MKEYKNDLDPHYSPFYAETFEARTHRKSYDWENRKFVKRPDGKHNSGQLRGYDHSPKGTSDSKLDWDSANMANTRIKANLQGKEDLRNSKKNAEYNVEFNEWADQELMSHGKDISFKDWAEDEGMKHGDVPITDWAQHEEESHDERYEAETDPLWLEKVKHQHYKDMIANLESRNDLTEMDRVRLHHYKDMVKINADEYGAEDNTESIKSAIRKLEKALGKMDGATYKMHDLDISAQPTTIAGFEMSRNGEKYDGGSYLIMTDGSIVNAAMGNADYGNITENFSAECEECGVSIENGKQVSGHYGENFCPPCARAIAEANPQFEVKETTQKDDFGAESIVKKYGMIAAGVITAFALLPEIKKRF